MARILVVDDVDVIRLVISKILKRAGHSVEEADSGEQALASISTRAVEVVVTDLWMPGLNGWGLIEALRHRFPSVALIAMSGGSPRQGQAASLDQARSAGVIQVLMKPVDKTELILAVERALESAGQRCAESDPARF